MLLITQLKNTNKTWNTRKACAIQRTLRQSQKAPIEGQHSAYSAYLIFVGFAHGCIYLIFVGLIMGEPTSRILNFFPLLRSNKSKICSLNIKNLPKIYFSMIFAGD